MLAQGLEVPSGHRAIGVPATAVPSEHPSPEYIATGAASYSAMAARFAVEEHPLKRP